MVRRRWIVKRLDQQIPRTRFSGKRAAGKTRRAAQGAHKVQVKFESQGCFHSCTRVVSEGLRGGEPAAYAAVREWFPKGCEVASLLHTLPPAMGPNAWKNNPSYYLYTEENDIKDDIF